MAHGETRRTRLFQRIRESVGDLRRTTFLLIAFSVVLVTGPPLAVGQEKEDLDSLLQDSRADERAAQTSEGEPRDRKAEPRQAPAEKRPADTPRTTDEAVREPATAQQRPIEEIIVTAQKREQRMQEVPIAMSVVDSEFIAEKSITDFRDMSFFVPNVAIDTSRVLIDVRIRGFGSPVFNKGFEQPVGLVIDGISYSRRPYWLGPIFDVDRVEVLRGPQGTLFGKNTTAGLVNVVTKKPTDTFTGHVGVELGELDRRRVEAAIGGPVIPGFLNVRIAGLDETRDGYGRNTTAAVRPEARERLLGRDRKAVRAQLGFPNLLGSHWNLSFEHVDVDLLGGGDELSLVRDSYAELARQYDPNADLEPENYTSSHDFAGGLDAKVNTFVVEGGYDFGEWSLEGVLGYSFLDNQINSHVDLLPAPAANFFSTDDNPQTTAEIRIASPNLPGVLGFETLLGFPLGIGSDFVTGFFYQGRSVDDSGLRVFVNPFITAQVSATNESGVVQPCPGCDSPENVEEGSIFWDQSTNSVAGFGQMNWYLPGGWSFQYGMRLTQEWKEANWQSVFQGGQSDGESTRLLFNGARFTDHLSRSEFAFTPKVALKYDWTDDVSAYASWGKGFKAGGFNEAVFNNEERERALQFDRESMTAWELGTKARLLGGAAQLNVALFRMRATDLQVFTNQPTGIAGTGLGGTSLLFTVNAGESLSQGAEVDFTWFPMEWLTLRAALGFNDSEFLEFPFGQCPPESTESSCDLSGEPLPFTPKWTSTLTGNVTWPLDSLPGLNALAPSVLQGVRFGGGLTVEYQDVHLTDFSLDPRGRQPSFFRLSGNLGLDSANRSWSLKLVGRNLNDVYVTKFFGFDQIAPGNFASTPAEPRLVFGKFRMEF